MTQHDQQDRVDRDDAVITGMIVDVDGTTTQAPSQEADADENSGVINDDRFDDGEFSGSEAQDADAVATDDPGARDGDPDAASPWEIDPDLIVTEVVAEPAPSQLSTGTPDSPVATMPGPAATAPPADNGASSADAVSQEWHDIQAAFVDDPHRSVQLAAEATSRAVDTLVEQLQAQQRALAGIATSAGETDTEALLGTLRAYRALWRTIEDIDLAAEPARA